MNDFIKTMIACLVLLGGGIAWAVTNFTPQSDFDKHLDAELSRYVLDLKQSIRDINRLLDDDPYDEYLIEDLEDTIATLCEIRPDDKLCQ